MWPFTSYAAAVHTLSGGTAIFMLDRLVNNPYFFTGSSVNERFLAACSWGVFVGVAGFVAGAAEGLAAR